MLRDYQPEVLEFLEDLASEDDIGLIYLGIRVAPSEVRDLIVQRTQLGESLYPIVETLYRALPDQSRLAYQDRVLERMRSQPSGANAAA